MNFLLIAIGGAAGSVLRYLCSRLLNNESFPYGTMAVNVIGCFLIGALWALFSKEAETQKRLLLITGFCGGFTTFSAFSLEAVQLLQQSRIVVFFIYSLATFILSLTATYIGFKLF